MSFKSAEVPPESTQFAQVGAAGRPLQQANFGQGGSGYYVPGQPGPAPPTAPNAPPVPPYGAPRQVAYPAQLPQGNSFTSAPGVPAGQAPERDDPEYTRLEKAVEKDHAQGIRRLVLREGAKLDAVSAVGRTALHTACVSVRLSAARELLQLGADANAVDSYGITPLHYLLHSYSNVKEKAASQVEVAKRVMSSIVDVALLLVGAGADVTIESNRGNTPLDVCNDPALAEDLRFVAKAYTILFDCARTGRLSGLEDLEGRAVTGMHVVQGSDGCSPIHVAVERHQHAALQALINLSLPLDVSDRVGKTPLHIACDVDDARAVQILLQGGAFPGYADGGKQTPLMIACRNGHAMCCAELIMATGIEGPTLALIPDEELRSQLQALAVSLYGSPADAVRVAAGRAANAQSDAILPFHGPVVPLEDDSASQTSQDDKEDGEPVDSTVPPGSFVSSVERRFARLSSQLQESQSWKAKKSSGTATEDINANSPVQTWVKAGESVFVFTGELADMPVRSAAVTVGDHVWRSTVTVEAPSKNGAEMQGGGTSGSAQPNVLDYPVVFELEDLDADDKVWIQFSLDMSLMGVRASDGANLPTRRIKVDATSLVSKTEKCAQVHLGPLRGLLGGDARALSSVKPASTAPGASEPLPLEGTSISCEIELKVFNNANAQAATHVRDNLVVLDVEDMKRRIRAALPGIAVLGRVPCGSHMADICGGLDPRESVLSLFVHLATAVPIQTSLQLTLQSPACKNGAVTRKGSAIFSRSASTFGFPFFGSATLLNDTKKAGLAVDGKIAVHAHITLQPLGPSSTFSLLGPADSETPLAMSAALLKAVSEQFERSIMAQASQLYQKVDAHAARVLAEASAAKEKASAERQKADDQLAALLVKEHDVERACGELKQLHETFKSGSDYRNAASRSHDTAPVAGFAPTDGEDSFEDSTRFEANDPDASIELHDGESTAQNAILEVVDERPEEDAGDNEEDAERTHEKRLEI